MNTYIVILTWNNSDDFARCIHSVGYGSLSKCELVVVENGSSGDEREKIIRACERLYESPWACFAVDGATVIQLPENIGIPAGQNRALDEIAKHDHGDYGVILLDADTIVQVDWIDKLLNFADKHPDVGIVGGGQSPNGPPCPVYHHPNGRWYVHDLQSIHPSGFMEGESVDFACVYLRPELMARGLRFDPNYEIYDGYDQDLTFRVRSWGYRVWQIEAGVAHYASSAMKKTGYTWSGGGRHEWDLLRERNVTRFSKIWEPFLAPYRDTIEREMAHMEKMNAKLIAEAGERAAVPHFAAEGKSG